VRFAAAKVPEIDLFSLKMEGQKIKCQVNEIAIKNSLYFEKTDTQNNKNRGKSLNVSKPGILPTKKYD